MSREIVSCWHPINKQATEIGGPLGVPVTKGLRNVFYRSKDAAVAFSVRVAIDTRLRSFGEMTELFIDTKKETRSRTPGIAWGK